MTALLMTPEDFGYIQQLVRDLSGNVLEEGKEYLVESRLEAVARRLGQESVRALVADLRRAPPDTRHHEVVETMTTKETMFFRDAHLFDALRDVVLPQLVVDRSALNIWCIGCATGQEPYSIAMLMKEHFPYVRLTLLASDISRQALELARGGRYGDFEMARGLSPELHARYFRRVDGRWEIDERIRSMVSYQRINLVEPLPFLPPMDLILFRNVMIYFAPDFKAQVLTHVRALLRPDGYLFVGAPENLMNYADQFQQVPLGRTLGYRRV